MSRHRDWDISCKVYIGNLGNSASKYELEDAFSKYGPLKNVWVARNPPGFAFVEFEDPRDAEDSVRGLDGTRVCGQRVRVEMSSGQSRNGGGSRREGRGSGRRRDDRVRRGDSAERVRRRRRSPSYRSMSRSRSRSFTPPSRRRRSRSGSRSE
uniref:RNA-binding protein 1 n=1 Tax=Caligus rogercresseyi TaxID=217165 RepID=C1BQB6_CALRO|nr:RNA-binding protein 1 [Caligus rogercresseyi]|eukprot:TRINITY_DN293_c0_g1_i3.p2 TRINITY_DN293_c0_g1~~TRINITY_DN293_c0_g1_i3.p2  ORF type:complete len:153 (+),score=35.42 TRINITY_DN293_c0_g1_i3:787-1245(+)